MRRDVGRNVCRMVEYGWIWNAVRGIWRDLSLVGNDMLFVGGRLLGISLAWACSEDVRPWYLAWVSILHVDHCKTVHLFAISYICRTRAVHWTAFGVNIDAITLLELWHVQG
jgi:hypothetical protein